MTYTELDGTGLSVSRICFGTLWIGGVDDADAVTTLQRAVDLGINFIDTAEGYGAGRSERIVGKALGTRRDQVVIATKTGLDNGQFAGKAPRGTERHINMAGQVGDTLRNSHPQFVSLAIDGSLQRLGTDYIDLYQIHYPDSAVPFADTVGALERARDAGKIRHFGVSNFTLPQLKAWLQAGPLCSLQPMYHLFARDIEAEVLPFCREQGIAVLPYSTLAHGLLTGKFRRSEDIPEDMRASMAVFSAENFPRNAGIVAQLQEMAVARGARIGQLAIAWALAQPGITSTLVAAKSPAQVEENAAAADLELSDEELRRIDQLVSG